MQWSAELMWGIEDTNQTVVAVFYNKSEPSMFPGQKYWHMSCPVSGQYLGTLDLLHVVNAAWIRCILEVTHSVYMDSEVYLYLLIALHHKNKDKNFCFKQQEKTGLRDPKTRAALCKYQLYGFCL